MQADYSGFANAASIQAQALANLGQQIGQGIEKYKKNKEITGVTLASIEGILASNPDLIALGEAEEGSIGKSFKQLQEDGNLNKRSAMEVKGYLDTIMESRAAQRQSEMDAATLANVQAQTAGMTAGEQRAAAAEDRAQQLFPSQLESSKVQVLGQEQAIAKSMADVNAQDTKLQMEQAKLDSVVKQQEIDQANAANQKRMLDSVTGGSMSNLEYIQAGGDMNALANAEKLTRGQSFATNQKMIQSIEEEFSYLTYDYKTNTWTDTRGRNRSGLPWQEFPELMNFLGTRESQALSNEGFTLGNTFN